MTSSKTSITSTSWLLSDLFRGGRFVVPWHQRYYDWEPRHVEELLLDIEEAVKEKRDCHFLGTVIFIERKPDIWEINDGQQRMITFSLICAALCRRFAHEVSDSQREGRALRILFDLDENTACSLDNALNYSPRITPQEDDIVHYEQMLRGNTIGTNGPITAAWEKIDDFIASQDLEESKKYFDFLVQKLEIARLQVPTNVDPNAVFETINCRGKILNDLDLIRNYIYSQFNTDENSEKRNSTHKKLTDIHTFFSVRGRGRPATLELTPRYQYMRCHLQCVFGFLRRDNLYRDFRREMRNQIEITGKPPEDLAFQLTEKVAERKSLALFSETIITSSPNLDLIRSFNTDCRKTSSKRNLGVFLRELREYRVTQPLVFALLKAYLDESDGQRKKRVAKRVHTNLSRLAAFVLRTALVAPKFEPSHFEAKFSNFAREIMQSNYIPNKKFVEFLLDCDRHNYNILDDSKFKEAVIAMDMKSGKPSGKIKQFLIGINNDLQRGPQTLNDLRRLTIEHILPRSERHWNGWERFSEVDPNEWINRIGNLTLLATGENKPGDRDNASFDRKKEIYEDSTLAITRKLTEYDEWTPENIERRQLDIAKRAVTVWRFLPYT